MPWFILIGYVLLLLFLDFFVLNKKGKEISVKKALYETLFFVVNALLFTGVVYWTYSLDLLENTRQISPNNAVIKYLTGYIIELSLSVDNLFVIAVIFTSFKIPMKNQHQLLFLGILGALIFRGVLIAFGLALLDQFEYMTVIFGLFLLFTALKMLKKDVEHEEVQEPSRLMKYFRLSKQLDGDKYITKINGKMMFTGLTGALITIEFTDLLFALDSIPAIFAVTRDPFIVYSSNIFAIMGLRSLYFFLANMLEKFVYLKYSVFSILIFVSIKLMTAQFAEIPEWFSLTFIILSLAIGVYASMINVNQSKKNK